MATTIRVREANEDDVAAIRGIFHAQYGGDYPYQGFLDAGWLKRSVYADDIIMLVAVDGDRAVGTASFVFDLGAHSDLLGEFGRLVVHPDARGRGVGSALMRARIEYIQNRVHVGLAQNRCVHPYSQQVSRAHGLVPLGFLPMKYQFDGRESVSIWGLHVGPALSLRRNHPRIIPEAATLASVCLSNVGLQPDAIVDEESPPYPHASGDWQITELSDAGLPALLRIERGRVRNREVFGPLRLTYGFFQIRARHATYLVARAPNSDDVVGAIGFLHDEISFGVHVFELIASTDPVVHLLWAALLERCAEKSVAYIEADVSAHAPRMQRTLLELGFLPAAYVPAMVFHQVERLDVVKMVRLNCAIDLGPLALVPESQQIADIVMARFTKQHVVPRIASVIASLPLFQGLSHEQARRVAGACSVLNTPEGTAVFDEGSVSERFYVVLDGQLNITIAGKPVGTVGAGEVLGEVAGLTGDLHSATATALEDSTLAVLERKALRELERLRPDVAVVLYRNLAKGLGAKLRRSDLR